MAFRLDRDNPLTYGVQVQRQTLAQLIAGRLRPGDRFPSVRKLARDLGISRTTGERIHSALCDATLAEVRPRSGVFVASPEDLTQRQHLLYARSVYALLKQTVLKGRALGLDSVRLAELIRAFDEQAPKTAGIASFPIIATRDWYECMLACLGPGFPGRLVHLQPNAHAAQFPADARYLLSSYYMRGRAREIATAVRRPVIYVRYNVSLLDRAMTSAGREVRYFVTRDADNADTTRQFLASAYPEIATHRYVVMSAHAFLEIVPLDTVSKGQVWATVTAAPLLAMRMPRERIALLHPLMAEDFLEELRSLALVW